MKISENSKGLSESYSVKFWYKNTEGFFEQSSTELYCNSKCAHAQVEKYFNKYIANLYSCARIVSVTYL